MKKLAFIGGGNMARALIGGMLDADPACAIHVVDTSHEALLSLQRDFGCSVRSFIDADVEDADIVILAVKPYIIHDICAELVPVLDNQLVISIAAAISQDCISGWLNGYPLVVRAMPNTPALAKAGVTGLFASAAVDIQMKALAEGVFETVSRVVWCEDEAMIDSVTGISGSGPAYVFYFIESLIEAGRQLGFEDGEARRIAETTFVGAIALLRGSTEPVEVLRQRVTSKGGTTAAAIGTLEHHGLMATVVEAARAARSRAQQMREEFEQAS